MVAFSARGSVVLALVVVLGGGASAAAVGQEPGGRADLAVSAVVEDKQFDVGAEVPVTVTIKNVGTADATVVKASIASKSGSGFVVDAAQWGDLGSGGTIASGTSRTVKLTGVTQKWQNDNPVVRVAVQSADDAEPANDFADFTVRYLPTGTKSEVGGYVFGDRNGNGVPDSGEGFAGVRVRLGSKELNSDALTDEKGHFTFGERPAQEYSLTVTGVPEGWLFTGSRTIVVDGTPASADVRFAAVRPLRESLTAKAEFTKAEYAPGAKATVRVALANTGANALTGITAACTGEGPQLAVASWGELGTGAAIGAGETRTFEVDGTVPTTALELGSVGLSCDFGADRAFPGSLPTASATAKVANPQSSTPPASSTTPTSSSTTAPTSTTDSSTPPPVADTPDGPLASTGASVLGISVLGLLALVAGAVAVLFARRRKSA
ncbi:SdrD B-like domain-containing protein [Umezawaea tangerina]|uniref:LPXTG-motif cell wall-anchored protein n=1 Tax=Umezawaea tangerina TaxID=84725 RepID=A0A2T0TKB4_9PSEU|nr:SdrD B-like domain-containing protein [Umezawaea tangerina]PRY45958.1 LPXTG-motif cell wall-anchored protein [Umezawaea tangerina]